MMSMLVVMLGINATAACAIVEASAKPILVVEACAPNEACVERWSWRRVAVSRVCTSAGL